MLKVKWTSARPAKRSKGEHILVPLVGDVSMDNQDYNIRSLFSDHENARRGAGSTFSSQRPRFFGQHQKSRPLRRSNTGSPRFTNSPSLCACSESSLTI